VNFNPAHRKRFALGRLRAGQMNGLESKYAEHLEALKQTGDVLWWKFEGIKLRLADNCFFTGDFAVQAADEVVEIHEVKGGFWQDDSRAKIKIASALYPFRFIGIMPIAKSKGGGWRKEEF
jgi:hypothetical protein